MLRNETIAFKPQTKDPLVSVWHRACSGGRWIHGRNLWLSEARAHGLTSRPGDTRQLATRKHEAMAGGTLAGLNSLFAYYPMGFNPNDRPDLPRCGAPATIE